MFVMHVVLRVLEAMFFAGIVGSIFIVGITLVQDVRILFERDQPPPQKTGGD